MANTRVDSWRLVGSVPRVERIAFIVGIILVGALAGLAQAYGLVQLGAWFPILVGLVTFAFFLFRMKRANAESVEGITFLNQGRFTEAVAAFERSHKRYPRSHVFIFNRGIALFSLWRVAEAEASFLQASRMKVANFSFDLERMVVPYLALTAALLGRLDEARQRITQADQLKLDRSAHLTIAKAVVALRSNELKSARELLASYEVKLLGGPTRGLADALTAWTAEQFLGQARPVDRVALFGEAGPDALRKVWPELVEFVTRAPEV